jgi:hypothetical protein
VRSRARLASSSRMSVWTRPAQIERTPWSWSVPLIMSHLVWAGRVTSGRPRPLPGYAGTSARRCHGPARTGSVALGLEDQLR